MLSVNNDYSFVDDPLNAYRAELKKVPPPGREEELECIQHVRVAGERAADAKQRLLEANLQLVVTIVERYPHNRMHILDLIQAGNAGLLRAIETLPDSSVDNLPIHATPFIERAIAEAFPARGSPYFKRSPTSFSKSAFANFIPTSIFAGIAGRSGSL